MIENSFLSLKLFLLGNSTVGKTSLIYKYLKNTFKKIYMPTIGFNNMPKNIILRNGKKAKIHFYDTAGQERYRSLTFNLIKSAAGIILMYDVTKKETFKAIPEWVKSIREHQRKDFPIVLIGNKCDLEEEREVKTEEGKEEAIKNGFSFFESSSKDGINVQEAVSELVSKIFEQNEKGGIIEEEKERKNSFILKKEKKSKKKKKRKC